MVVMLLPSLFFSTVKAQEVLTLDLEKALEIALSENPTVKVARQGNRKEKVCTERFLCCSVPSGQFYS